MQSAYKNPVVILSFLLTFLPYSIFLKGIGAYQNILLMCALISLQIIALITINLAKNSTQSKSLKLFWQYLLMVTFGGGLANIVLIVFPTLYLLQDFLSLFSYFFIFLAIETNPHLKETPVNKYSGGRVPAIFFVVVCFSYFILLPYEFSELQYQSRQPSVMFHLFITGLIGFRLLISFAKSTTTYWRHLYGMLLCGALIIFSDNLLNFFEIREQQSIFSLFNDVFILLPFLTLIIASKISLTDNNPAISQQYEVNSELYMLLLVLGILSLHLLGEHYQLFYRTNHYWQSVIVLGWFSSAVVFVALLSRKKRKAYQQLKLQLHDIKHQLSGLKKQNESLNKAIIYSENKAIVNASNNAILTVSKTGKILSANPSAVQVFQLLEQDLIDSSVSTLFSPDDKMHYFFDYHSNVYELQRKEQGLTLECKAIRSDKSEFPVQVELQWADRQESPLIVITFINLTARKLAEKQALELKDKFIANISHEFRTPLTIINGVLDRYLQHTESRQEQQELTTAKRNGLRLVRMVEQLLELSRLNDNPKMSLAIYRLETLMQMPGDSFTRLAKQSQLAFNINIPADLWLECDAQAFEKIIFNLLSNAIKYTPAGGTINVNAYQEKDTIILDIIDTGIGISKTSQDKIFDRFQRADDQENQAIFGVGIGLSLVNELVKAHHWRINLVSEYNNGSKFSLSIPTAKPITKEAALPYSISEEELASILVEQNEPKKHIQDKDQQVVLIIEDNIDMQSHIKQVVEQAHHCILASSGELGLSIAQEYIPDLIVCDIMLTGIDGFEVLKQLKENDITSHIPVILLTARSDLDSRLHGLNLHADDYLSKPFNQQELLVRIDNLIQNRENLQQSHLNKFKAIQTSERKAASHEKASLLTSEDNVIDSVEEVFLEKLEMTIAQMYINPELGITQLAQNMAMSERQLQRKIKVILGTTPNNFIKEFRLKKAQELLKSGAQIGRIALDVGFSSQTYFGRCFKETYHCTPKQYQQKCANESTDL
ncbi:ATP-binding protein [Thalassotalea sp. SU-HH00458]|uniref:hybrid sensor histidine kinase/response regulator transcription factor n=1 Tax=Thalassotalea sp. SU-HH00458 TaxID=3127657 RepID=UPI0031050065